MNISEYEKMAKMEDFYWWHVGRKSILKHLLSRLESKPRRILNVGCGTGGLISLLEGFGEVTNVDPSKEAVSFCHRKGFANVIAISEKSLPFPDRSFDLIVATDVLEHINDDLAALHEWRRVLSDGGALVMTVPAYQWLWSSHDEALHHFRRYSASQLHNLVNRAGFLVNKRSYIIVFSFPLIVGYRLFSSIIGHRKIDAKPKEESSYVILPAPINRLFIFLLQVEALLLKYINFPFGTSIILHASKSPSPLN